MRGDDVTGSDVIEEYEEVAGGAGQSDDDVLHKVRLSLNVTRMDAVRVQVGTQAPSGVLRCVVLYLVEEWKCVSIKLIAVHSKLSA